MRAGSRAAAVWERCRLCSVVEQVPQTIWEMSVNIVRCTRRLAESGQQVEDGQEGVGGLGQPASLKIRCPVRRYKRSRVTFDYDLNEFDSIVSGAFQKLLAFLALFPSQWALHSDTHRQANVHAYVCVWDIGADDDEANVPFVWGTQHIDSIIVAILSV